MLHETLAYSLFLHPDSYLADRKYIDVLPGRSLQEAYGPDERFLTRIHRQEEHFSRYGGSQVEYNHRAGETALALSRVLWACDGNLTAQALTSQFADYWLGYDGSARPHGLYTTCLPHIYDLTRILWTHTKTPCEMFFAYLAAHRHLIAQEAEPDNDEQARPFGRNRYYDYLTATSNEQRAGLISYLKTDLTCAPYLTALNKFRQQGKRDEPSYFITRNFYDQTCPVGCLTKGVLVNWMTPPDCYEAIFTHMDELFTSITGPALPDARTFLERVFEVQYWYIHIMPCERGSLAVMNMFRYAMLAYYNRRQHDETRWLPLAPNRTNVYPDLEALLLRDTLANFIEASMRELYCVDYNKYCDD